VIRQFRSDPFIFRTIVPEAGYEWVKGHGSELYLVSKGEDSGFAWVKEPTAMNPGLFVEFANVKPSKDPILQFANNWGDIFFRGELLPDHSRKRKAIAIGESLEAWKDAIDQMRVLVRLWEAIKDHKNKSKRAELQKIITWVEGGVRYAINFKRGSSHSWLAHPKVSSPSKETLLARLTPGDVVWPAKHALQAEINRRISDESLPIFPQLIWTHERNQRIIFTPKCLLAAMWLQFAQAITQEFQLRVCEGCGKYFQFGPGGKKRADAKTCSDACRQRKRRKK